MRFARNRVELNGWSLCIAVVITFTIIVYFTPPLVSPKLQSPEFRKIGSDDLCFEPPRELVAPFDGHHHSENGDWPGSSGSAEANGDEGFLVSPLRTTMAIIRWNKKRTERIPLLMKYQPFFHTIHLSMPDMLPDEPAEFHNRTHDQFSDSDVTYIQVAHTMRLILETEPDITGLMYFHFDAWIDPLAWADNSLERIWLPAIGNTRKSNYLGPRFMCANSTRGYEYWWQWKMGMDKIAIAGNQELKRLDVGYNVHEDEFCNGWADIYYIPRRYFGDFIFLSYLYGCRGLMHEVAVPTMVHIIDQSRRKNQFQSVINRIGDCWGSCCDDTATAIDVQWTRCGHRLDYLQRDVVEAQYGRLDEQASWLGKPVKEV